MAEVATETVHLTINDVELEVPKGELIVEAVKRLGLEVPIFCYHPRMKPVGMCRMCLVEVGFKQPDGSIRKMPKPQAACTLPASEGMAIYTDSEMVHRDRKGVLEFLLINHPLDCPICDRGGECPLQNNTIFYGPSTSRFIENKRRAPKAFPLSKHVTLDLERCIQCGRCVRFTEEISGDSQLAFRFRGARMQPSTFELTDFDSKFSGNVIEICPVGALTSSDYRFRARPWDLETKPSICTECSVGCNTWFDHRAGRLVRVNARTNEAINEEWTCDKGKFGHGEYYADNRLETPLMRHGDKLVSCDWSEAYAPILEAFRVGGDKVAALAGPKLSNESYFLAKRLFGEAFGSKNLDSRWTRHLPPNPYAFDGLPVPFRMVDSSMEGLESKRSIVVFGASLADEVPVVYLRVRKAWSQFGAKVSVAHSAVSDAESFAAASIRFKPGAESAVALALLKLTADSGAALSDSMRALAQSVDLGQVEAQTGASLDSLKAFAADLNDGAALLMTRDLFNAPTGVEAARALAGLCAATGAEFNLLATGANEQGALNAGFVPMDGGSNALETLQACIDGKISALWLAGVDPFQTGLDRALVEKALESVEFLVVQDVAESEAMAYASVALPMTAPAEESGSWTNCFGIEQAIEQTLKPRGQAKPAWRVFNEFLLRAQPQTPFFSVAEIAAERRQLAAAGS